MSAVQLPIIDVAPFLHISTSSTPDQRIEEAARELHNACRTYGFFYLRIESFVDPEEPEGLLCLANDFFALPQEEKDQFHVSNQDGARGYARLKENHTAGKTDNHESIDFYKPVSQPDKAKVIHGENQWPVSVNIPEFRSRYERWIEKMLQLGMIVNRAMAIGLGLSQDEQEDLLNRIKDSFWIMRIVGYPPLPDDHNGLSCGIHRDYGCLTFLYTDHTQGALEIFHRPLEGQVRLPDVQEDPNQLEEGVWIKADPIPGCIVCNVGESMSLEQSLEEKLRQENLRHSVWEAWTNGVYKSILHRVVHRGTNYRVSIPFFFEPNFDTLYEALPAFRNRGEKQEEVGSKAISYGEYLLDKTVKTYDMEG